MHCDVHNNLCVKQCPFYYSHLNTFCTGGMRINFNKMKNKKIPLCQNSSRFPFDSVLSEKEMFNLYLTMVMVC